LNKFARVFSRYAEIVPEFPGFLEAVSRPAPVHFRVNTLKAPVEQALTSLRDEGIEAEPVPWSSAVWRVEGGSGLGATLAHALGHIYVQSASSAFSALTLGARPGDRVLDLCAAPGSKSTFVAQMMEDRGALVANEPNGKRLKSLTTNLERMGVTSAVVTSYSGQNFPTKVRFHRALVDAPCSGEGTWRGPEARPKSVAPDFRKYLGAQQKALLGRAYEVLEPGGRLVYSTCTYAPEENESVVAALVTERGASVLPLEVDVPGLPGLTAWGRETYPAELALTRRLYPHFFDSEGFFVARLAKP
jgi:NOL1/NOP2/sun family putative RNA methylase